MPTYSTAGRADTSDNLERKNKKLDSAKKRKKGCSDSEALGFKQSENQS